MKTQLLAHGFGVAYFGIKRGNRWFLLFRIGANPMQATGKQEGYENLKEAQRAASRLCSP